MAKVQLIDGRIVSAPLTNISSPDEEGSRSATAHTNGRAIPVYNSIIDGFNDVWVEQMTIEEWREMKAKEARE